MTKSQDISLIFLSLAIASRNGCASFDNISAIADGINHAVPTHKELQSSIAWLIHDGLAFKKGNKYQLTDEGHLLYHTSVVKAEPLLIIWQNLEDKINQHFPTS